MTDFVARATDPRTGRIAEVLRQRRSRYGYEVSAPVPLGRTAVSRGGWVAGPRPAAPRPGKRSTPPRPLSTGRELFAELDDCDVLAAERVPATFAAERAAKALGLPRLRVHFFVGLDDPRYRLARSRKFRGEAWTQGISHPGLIPDAVLVRVGPRRSSRYIANTVLHEARHLVQRRLGIPERDHESDAKSFAEQLVSTLGIPD